MRRLLARFRPREEHLLTYLAAGLAAALVIASFAAGHRVVALLALVVVALMATLRRAHRLHVRGSATGIPPVPELEGEVDAELSDPSRDAEREG